MEQVTVDRNEEALLAVRRDSDIASMNDLDLAIERAVAGLRREMSLKDEVKRRNKRSERICCIIRW